MLKELWLLLLGVSGTERSWACGGGGGVCVWRCRSCGGLALVLGACDAGGAVWWRWECVVLKELWLGGGGGGGGLVLAVCGATGALSGVVVVVMGVCDAECCCCCWESAVMKELRVGCVCGGGEGAAVLLALGACDAEGAVGGGGGRV